jgi:tetratricopeptide (TPR) repeat protein
MKKYLPILIAFILAIVLVLCFPLFVRSQGSNDLCFKDKSAVCLDDRFLFSIVGSYGYQTKAEIIQKRIEAIARDSSISIDSVNIVENPKTATEIAVTKIVADNLVVIEITDIDAKQEGFNSRRKLGEYYLGKIQENIPKYRRKQQISLFFDRAIKLVFSRKTLLLILVALLILLVFLFFGAFFSLIVWNTKGCKRMIRRWKKIKSQKLTNNLVQSAKKTGECTKQLWKWFRNRLGNGLELIVFLIIFTLLTRLILIFFKMNFESILTERISEKAFSDLLTQIVNLSQILGLIILLGFLSILLHWFSSRGAGTVVLTFEETTALPNIKGKAIANLLVVELHRIRDIHTRLIDSIGEVEEDLQQQKLGQFNFPPLTPIRENIESYLSDIGSFEVGKNRFDFGRILLILRWLWPFGGVNRVIHGSIQTSDSETRLIVRLEYENQLNAWEVTCQPKESIADKIRDLAYIVSRELIPNITAQTWEGFKFLTEAILRYYQYQQTLDLKYLQESEENCKKAQQAESQSEKFYEKLSDLFYEIGRAYLDQEKYAGAENSFKSAIQVNPKNKYAYNGLGNVYYAETNFDEALNQYKYSRRLNEDFPYPDNGIGNVFHQKGDYGSAIKYYNSACLKDKKNWHSNFWKPYNNLGIIYLYRNARSFEEKLKDYDESIDYFEKAIAISKNTENTQELYPPYSGLALAYLFRNSIPEGNRNNQFTGSAKTRLVQICDALTKSLQKKSQNDLNRAIDYIQKALDIALDTQPYLYWNLGLIKLAEHQLGKACDAWKKAAELARIKNDQLCYEIYRYTAHAFSTQGSLNANSQQYLEGIKKLLSRGKFSKQKGRLKVMKKDLEMINTILNCQFSSLDVVISELKNAIDGKDKQH